MWSQLTTKNKGSTQRDWFRAAFESVGMTRQDMADALGLNRSSFSRWVTGEAKMRRDVMEKVLKCLERKGCPPDKVQTLKRIPTVKGRGKLKERV